MSKRKKLALKISLGIVVFLIASVIINFIPTFNLKTSNMKELNGNWVNVYYESEESAAKDVFQYADNSTNDVAKKLGFTEKQNVNVYIYDHQNTMQTKKYGLVAPLLKLDWYIGDNIGTNVILTSPANPGNTHNYDSIKNAVLHEIVHAYVSVINKNIDLWLTEGTALYLANGSPFYKKYVDQGIPSYKKTCSNNPITFEKCRGYVFSHTYIEYLDLTYGWNAVLSLIQTEDYDKCFGKSRKEIYDEWVNYISNYHQ